MSETTTPASSTVPTGKTTAPGALFRNRDYLVWQVGDTVSSFGSVLSAAAYPLLILFVTGSATQAGVVAAAESIGLLVTLLIGGALADRYSRRTILIIGPIIEATAVSTVVYAVITHHVTVGHVAAVGLLQGLVDGLTTGASRPALRRVVPAAQLPAAFAQMTGRAQGVRLIAPTIGGILFSITRWLPFLGDALSFLASAAAIASIRTPLGPDRIEHILRRPGDQTTPSTSREPILRSIATGIRFIRGNSYLVFIAAWTAVINACLSAIMVLTIILVVHHGGGPTAVGLTSSIGAIGGLTGAFAAARIARRYSGRAVVLTLGWIVTIAFAGISLVPDFVLIGVSRAVLGLLIVPLNVILMSYEIRIIPDELTGRVTSAITFLSYSLTWLGPLGAGLLAATYGPTIAGLLVTGVTALLALSAHLTRSLHLLDKPLDEIAADIR